MGKGVFSRYELKYLIDMPTYKQIRAAILPYMTYDKNGWEGKYNIISLYFETPENRIYYETKDGQRFRQKLRLRAYNQVQLTTNVFFEIKQKHRGRVNKRRTRIILTDAYDYLAGQQVDQANVSNPQVFREIQAFRDLYNLQPSLMVSYDRQAFQGQGEGNLRVTFDYNLQCRSDELRLEYGPAGQIFVDPSLVILEIKVSDSVPLWLAKILSQLGCYKSSFSKYCTAFEFIDRGGDGHGLITTNHRWTDGDNAQFYSGFDHYPGLSFNL